MLINNDFNAQNELQHELIPDESLLWTGHPKNGIVFRSSDVFLIPFSIMWFAFAIFWESGVVSSGAPFFFMLWGIPFLCMGLYFTIGRFFYEKALRASTLYGITTNRIIIKSGVFKKTTETLNIYTLQNLTIDEKADGSGSIKLAADNIPFRGFAIRGWPGVKLAPELDLIPDVRSIYNLILKQQHKNTAT
jgi:hypothetical protein